MLLGYTILSLIGIKRKTHQHNCTVLLVMHLLNY